MKVESNKPVSSANSWGTVQLGNSTVPLRWVVLWLGFALWLGTILIYTGVNGITAFSFNISVVIAVALLSSLTRSVTLRTAALMFFVGATAPAVVLIFEMLTMLAPESTARAYVVPFIEQCTMYVLLIAYLFITRKFTFWTLGLTDMVLMGVLMGAGFAIVNDAFVHNNNVWEHAIQWLPTADFVDKQHLVVGHGVWGGITATGIGLAFFFLNNRWAAAAISLVGLSWSILDHLAANLFNPANEGMLKTLQLVSLNGYVSAYLLVVCLSIAILVDVYILVRFSPQSSEFMMKKKNNAGNQLENFWDFMLDMRRFSFASFKCFQLPDSVSANMTVAILAQSLINYNSSGKMAKVFEALSDRGEGTMQLSMKTASEEDQENPFLSMDIKLPDQYQLISRLSVGGMGAIYKARHRKTNAILAIKVLHPHIALKQNSKQRFEIEAKAASALKHPNIIVVHDYGLTPAEIPYMVMELIEGRTLKEEILKYKSLPAGRFFKVFIQVCEALEHAHKRGVIHRDVKPSNILLMDTDTSKDIVKVVDFGIAKVITENDSETQELTQTGDIIGSPLYMSPEQCVGDPLDNRTDIYSLGCVMYESLVGRPPLADENVVKTIFKHVNVKPDNIAKARPDLNIPPQVEEVIFKSLEKSPSDRYPNIEALRMALISCRDVLNIK